MTIALKPGLRQKIYLGGWNLDDAPGVFQPKAEGAKTSQRLANGTWFSSYASLWTGNCGKITKREWNLAFEAPTADDLLHLRMLGSAPLTFDLCPWVAEAEYFPTLSSAVASRRNAPTVISGGLIPAGTWTASWFDSDLTERAVTWGSADSALPWHHPFSVTSGVAPGWLVYFPDYRVEIQVPDIDFALAHREKHVLSLKEI